MKKTKFYKIYYITLDTKKPPRYYKIIEAFNKTQAKEALQSIFKRPIKIIETIEL